MLDTEKRLDLHVANRVKPDVDGYSVHFDAERYMSLLEEEQYRPQSQPVKVDLTNITPRNRLGLKTNMAGRFHPTENKVDIYTKTHWDAYQSMRKKAKLLLEGNENEWALVAVAMDGDSFDGFLLTERMRDYLVKNGKSPEEKLAFADKMLLNAVNRLVNGTIIHETKHLIDAQEQEYMDEHYIYYRIRTPLVSLTGIPFGIAMSAMSDNNWAGPVTSVVVGAIASFISYTAGSYISPLEERAYAFENERMFKPEYQGILSLQPA